VCPVSPYKQTKTVKPPEPLVMVPEDGPSEAPIGVLVPTDELLFEFGCVFTRPIGDAPFGSRLLG
jgi:hypothetical protein